jgi:hypothetical protein
MVEPRAETLKNPSSFERGGDVVAMVFPNQYLGGCAERASRVFPGGSLPDVAEPSERDSLPSPPALPHRLADPVPAILGGTALWLVALGALLLLGADRIWVWTSVSGSALGIIGYGVFTWQRSAARRGSRSAQRGLES